MNQAPTDWVSAVAILAGGIILGLLFLVLSRRKSAPIEADLETRDLEAKRDALIQQLRDLDEKATPEERGRLERETADVLRRLDARAASAAASRPATQQPSNPATASSSMNPTIKGFLWGAGSFAVLAAMLFFVWQKSDPREEGQPGTGSTPMAQQQPATDPMIRQLEQAVAKDPQNDALRTMLAGAYFDRENVEGVLEQTSIVLQRNPDNARALTLNALMRLRNEPDVALQMLQRSTRIDPKDANSWVALAWVYALSGRMQDAETTVAEGIRASPESKADFEAALAQMKSHAQQAAGAPQIAAATGTDGLPPGHPPVQQEPSAAPAAGGKSVTVTLDLDPAARSRTGVLFVLARSPAGGPPVAVKRLMATNFPVTIELSAADSMMGQPLPDQFRLEARLDSDGDAMTKPPTDPSARAENVAPGATVKLALK